MQIPNSSRYQHLNPMQPSHDTPALNPAPPPAQLAARPARAPATFNPWPWVTAAAIAAVSILWLVSK